MIKSSSEPALRAGSEGGVFQNFSRGGGFSRIFNSRGVLEYPPLAIPDYDVCDSCTMGPIICSPYSILGKLFVPYSW